MEDIRRSPANYQMLVLLAHSLSAPLLECTPICSYELLRGHCPALRWESGGEVVEEELMEELVVEEVEEEAVDD